MYKSGWRISDTQEPQCLCRTPLYLWVRPISLNLQLTLDRWSSLSLFLLENNSRLFATKDHRGKELKKNTIESRPTCCRQDKNIYPPRFFRRWTAVVCPFLLCLNMEKWGLVFWGVKKGLWSGEGIIHAAKADLVPESSNSRRLHLPFK
jgi:hypothetical protein